MGPGWHTPPANSGGLLKEKGIGGYTEILNDIRSLLGKAEYRAYKAVDDIRVQIHWHIGERIVCVGGYSIKREQIMDCGCGVTTIKLVIFC